MLQCTDVAWTCRRWVQTEDTTCASMSGPRGVGGYFCLQALFCCFFASPGCACQCVMTPSSSIRWEGEQDGDNVVVNAKLSEACVSSSRAFFFSFGKNQKTIKKNKKKTHGRAQMEWCCFLFAFSCVLLTAPTACVTSPWETQRRWGRESEVGGGRRRGQKKGREMDEQRDNDGEVQDEPSAPRAALCSMLTAWLGSVPEAYSEPRTAPRSLSPLTGERHI